MNLIIGSKMYEKKGDKDREKLSKPTSLDVHAPGSTVSTKEADSNNQESYLQGEPIKCIFDKGKYINEVTRKEEQEDPLTQGASNTAPIPDQTDETIYLCNFRVSVDGDWLCLKELDDYGGGDPLAAEHDAHNNEVKSCKEIMTSSLLTPTFDKSIYYPNYPAGQKGR